MLLTTMILTFGLQQIGGDWKTELQFAGSVPNEHLGWVTIPIGDLNDDQYSEILITAPYLDLGNPIHLGAVYIYSGVDGTELFEVTGLDVQDATFLGWRACSLNDVDQDTVSDFAFSAAGSTGQLPYSVFVYSGATFNQITRLLPPPGSLEFGFKGVCGGKDFNGDSVPDLLVIDDRFTGTMPNQGAVFAYDSITWQLLWQVEGSIPWQQLGGNVGCIDDLDGDNLADVLVYSNLSGSKGSVHVLSGSDGTELYRIEGPSGTYTGIGALLGIGDVDGDNLEDFAIDQNAGSGGLPGNVNIYSGANGILLHQIEGESSDDDFPGPLALVGDIDGDGYAEFTSSAQTKELPGSGRGMVYVFSSRDWSVFGKIPATADSDRFGRALGGNEDLTGDGWPDITIGDDTGDPNGISTAGLAYVYSFDPFLRASTTSVSSQVGGLLQFDIQFPVSEANKSYRLLTSTDLPGSTIVGDLAIPLKQSSLSWYLARNPQPWFTGTYGQLDANGYASAAAQIPPNKLAAYVGTTLKFAAVTHSPTNKPERSSAAAFVRVDP